MLRRPYSLPQAAPLPAGRRSPAELRPESSNAARCNRRRPDQDQAGGVDRWQVEPAPTNAPGINGSPPQEKALPERIPREGSQVCEE